MRGNLHANRCGYPQSMATCSPVAHASACGVGNRADAMFAGQRHECRCGTLKRAPHVLLVFLLLIAPGLLRGDERTQKLAERLAEEASAFQRLAPQVLGEETLHQRALKPPPRFRPRLGSAA